MAMGDKRTALKEYASVLEANMPDTEKAIHHNTYAKLLQENKRLTDARKHLEKALQFDPGHIESKYDMGSLANQQKKYTEAAALFGEVVRALPTSERAWLSQAASLVLAKKNSEAIEVLAAGSDTLPRSVILQHQLARMLTLITSDEANADMGLILARDAYAKDNSALHAETFAMALARNGHFKEAADLQAALVKSAKNNNAKGAVKDLEANLKRYQKKQKCCADMSMGTILGQP